MCVAAAVQRNEAMEIDTCISVSKISNDDDVLNGPS